MTTHIQADHQHPDHQSEPLRERAPPCAHPSSDASGAATEQRGGAHVARGHPDSDWAATREVEVRSVRHDMRDRRDRGTALFFGGANTGRSDPGHDENVPIPQFV